jgi:hypothetical protein
MLIDHEHPGALHPAADHDHAGRCSSDFALRHRSAIDAPVGQRSAERGLSHDPGVSATPARRQFRHDGRFRGHHRLRSSSATIAGIDSMSVRQFAGHHLAGHPPVRASTAASTPPPRTCRRPSRRRRRRNSRSNMTDPAVLQQGQSRPTTPSSTSTLTSAHAADVRRWTTYGQTHDRPADLDGRRRGTGRWSTARSKYAVRVQLDPYKLAVLQGLGIDDVSQAVDFRQNVDLPTGIAQRARNGPSQSRPTARSPTGGELYMPLVVAYRNGQPVRMREIGQAVDSVENNLTAAWYIKHDSRQRSIVLAVLRQPGTNVIEVADAIKALLRASPISFRPRSRWMSCATAPCPSASPPRTSSGRSG